MTFSGYLLFIGKAQKEENKRLKEEIRRLKQNQN
jgi:hypothetical protein